MADWINFVKSFCAKKGISYKQALMDPECKAEYHRTKINTKEVVKGNVEFRNRRKTNKLLNFGEETIEIPREMVLDNKAVSTLTPSKTIRRRNKQPAINIEPTDNNQINIISSNKSHDEKFEEFKPELKQRVKARNIMKGMSGLMI